ncbi:translocon-associated protein subunit alpha [Amborella trichopoda]|uniref:Translocon-associated protein subunit alpha n=1 Tax=Amborella trichopoda TaxID=13333 RepID=W1PZG0_AMBTC|nr:translocon-associated protein subunit alpha [Amborella trichopoda]ERN13451.1 hypothetical protein AMTR_s00041p00203840 [Amborella trichopoda]|eukprot:XP_006851984.1 translocon-associated protein subunit alpha [Amborella trichopoda]
MAASATLRVFIMALLFLSSPFLTVVRCQGEGESDVEGVEAVESGDLGIVGDDFQDSVEAVFGSAPGVDTICLFPKNPGKVVPAGEETELLVGVNNEGESPLKVLTMRATLHLPFDHKLLVQNLTLQEFYNASVPLSVQSTFPYIFAVNKYLQPGSFDLVGTIMYEVDEQQYQSVFYNGTIEVVEAGGFVSVESVFLFTLGLALIGLFGLWIYGQIQNISKKTKRVTKVEVGTKTTDASMDEWLQGTAFTQSNKSKKKK